MCDCLSSLRGFLLRQGLPRGHTPLPGITHSDKPIQCQVTTLSIGVVTDDAGDNTNVLIVLHPFGIGIALARHQQLQDAIHILW